jgi:hypothetical protein
MNKRDELRLHPALIRENENAVEQPRTESEDKQDEQAINDGGTTEEPTGSDQATDTEDLFQGEEDVSE